MEKYEGLEVDVIVFENEDIITDSGETVGPEAP